MIDFVYVVYACAMITGTSIPPTCHPIMTTFSQAECDRQLPRITGARVPLDGKWHRTSDKVSQRFECRRMIPVERIG